MPGPMKTRKGIDDYLERRRRDLAKLPKPKPSGKKQFSPKGPLTRKPKYF